MDLDLETSVPDWLIEHPQILTILEELQIDYCCGGKSLEFACRERSLDPQQVLARLRAFLQEAGSADMPEAASEKRLP
jgi:regulator of cell morphogenesis and NO signaling